MRIKIVLTLVALLFSSAAAYPLIIVNEFSDIGWQHYTKTFTEAWSGQVGFVVSDVIDMGSESALLLDNLSFDVLADDGTGAIVNNNSFEPDNIFLGYTADGYVDAVTGFDSYVSSRHYAATNGDFFLLMLTLDNTNWNTYEYGGTQGAFIWTANDIFFPAGSVLSFDWAFMGNDYYPYQDFALFLLKQGEQIVYNEKLAQICPDQNSDIEDQDMTPEPATLLMFGTGLLGLGAAIRRKYL